MQEAVSYEIAGPVYGNSQNSVKNKSENELNTDLSPILIAQNSPKLPDNTQIKSNIQGLQNSQLDVQNQNR